MARFLNKDPSDTVYPWLEWQIQAFIVQELRKQGFLVVGDMAAGKRNPGMAKATGLLAGHPDLSIWLPGGVVALIELKRMGGRISPEQTAHHAKLEALGHKVHVVWAECPDDGLQKVFDVINPTPQK